MENELIQCLTDIESIKKYLVKKGKSRFSGNILQNKLEESEIIYEKSKQIIKLFSDQKYIKPEKLKLINSTWENIKDLYNKILELSIIPESDSDSIMEFDLKTACNLIPVMDNNENTSKRIIDSVEMYSEMLSDSGKKLLIKFVLKSRLSENAKLRLSTEYSSISDLVKDLRKCLLTKKSFTAIQSRLQSINQGWRTIDQYGAEIEKLFSDLTISQADGNTESYAVLKPLNEKIAIKRFSDGLRDSRLSTIIAARNYEHLNEAIQAAKDEELHAASTSKGEGVMYFSRRGTEGKPQRPYYNRQFNGRYRGQQKYTNPLRNNATRGNYPAVPLTGNTTFNNGYRRTTYYANRGRGTRFSRVSRSSYGNTRSSGNQRVFYADQVNQNDDQPTQSNNNIQFFRA